MRYRITILNGKLAILLLAVFWIVNPAACYAEVQTLALPDSYSDFAMDPKSGDLVALEAENGKAVLFRANDLNGGSVKPASSLRVGSTPISVFYKEYQQVGFFAVVCSQDTHMYLIKANDFSLAAKVELSQGGVSLVTGSRNNNDPFLYYCYGAGHDSHTGVVSLRDFKNKGRVFGDSMDCAISAFGDVVYRRGPWSPSGFQSLTRTNEVEAEIPTFARLFYKHTSTPEYFPDPFNRFTASGNKIYTHSLEKHMASLDFVPREYFQDRPLIVGIKSTSRLRSRKSSSEKVTLKVASYNTFSSLGDPVSLSLVKPKKDGAIARAVPSNSGFKRVTKNMRLFADGQRDRVVLASRGQVHFIPLADFNIPDEPFLLADLVGAEGITVGRESKFKLVPRDKRVELEVEDIPEGVERDGLEFSWTPSLDSVGLAKFAVTLKHKDIQRSLNFDLKVAYPRLELPFAPADMAVTTDGKHGLIWEGVLPDRFGSLTSNVPQGPVRVAVIDLESGKVKAERKLASPIGKVLLLDESCIIWSRNATPKFYILELANLENKKTVVTSGPIVQVESAGELVLVRTTNQIEAYETKQWKRIQTFKRGSSSRSLSMRNSPPTLVCPDGILLNNLLFDFTLKPKLLTSSLGLPTLAGANSHGESDYLNTFQQTRYSPTNSHFNTRRNGTSKVGASPIPGSNNEVHLTQSLNTVQVPGATHPWRNIYELSVSSTGDMAGRQVLLRKSLHAQSSGTITHRPLIKASMDAAIVVYQKSLYRWPIPDLVKSPQDDVGKFAFVPRQSAFVIGGDGTTLLNHKTIGGKAPVEYSVLSPHDGVQFDEKTGNLTVDNAKLLQEAAKTLESQIVRRSRGSSFVDSLRNRAVQQIQTGTTMLGRRPKGLLVAIPIRVDATDANLAKASIQYFLMAEVPTPQLMSKMQKLDQERQQKIVEAQAMKKSAKEAPGTEGQRELVQRVQALEARIDLLTRQMAELLRKIDEK